MATIPAIGESRSCGSGFMARPVHSLTLFTREAQASTEARVAAPKVAQRQLWISVCLPSLALESLGVFHVDEPVAVTESGRDQLHIAAANEAARNLGVRPGLKLSAAFALAASLKVIPRSPQAESACLESLAAWAQRLTPLVSLEPPDSMSLEVAGSLKLFGGLGAVKAALAEELERRRWRHRACAAPTALASLWLARHGGSDVLQSEPLAGHIGALPLQVTGWPPATLSLLADMGVRTVGECCRLPRDGFARRVGRRYLDDLDKALGRRFDPRCGFKAPENWSRRIELFEESSDVRIFLAAIDEMLDGLAGKLRTDQAQIQSFRIGFTHRHCSATVESFDLLEPSSQKGRLSNLVAARLERLTLQEPAIALSLDTGILQPLHLRAADLFAGAANGSANILIERLRERFGMHEVYGVAPVAEHRPEYAWMKVLGGLPKHATEMRKISPWARDRPLWVFPSPLPLTSQAARRHYEGSLQLRPDPERIESGWWDEQDVRRDYYTAVSSNGQRLWVFQDRDGGAWHLHGIFG